MLQNHAAELKHFGVKGMRWGRTNGPKSATPEVRAVKKEYKKQAESVLIDKRNKAKDTINSAADNLIAARGDLKVAKKTKDPSRIAESKAKYKTADKEYTKAFDDNLDMATYLITGREKAGAALAVAGALTLSAIGYVAIEKIYG